MIAQRARIVLGCVGAALAPNIWFLIAFRMAFKQKVYVEGAKWCCSPPLRDKAAQAAIWLARPVIPRACTTTSMRWYSISP